jgi:hypothetical protein
MINVIELLVLEMSLGDTIFLFCFPQNINMFDMTRMMYFSSHIEIFHYTLHVWCLRDVGAYNFMMNLSHFKCNVACDVSHLLNLGQIDNVI